mgnify:CR=1 FL=1
MAISAALASLIEQLRKVVFLTGLDDSVLAALARGALWRDYAAGEVVFLEGETSPGLYVLQRGWLKVLKTSPEGREQVLRFIGPGETFNEIGVFAQLPNPATAIALVVLFTVLLFTGLAMFKQAFHRDVNRDIAEKTALVARILNPLLDQRNLEEAKNFCDNFDRDALRLSLIRMDGRSKPTPPRKRPCWATT